MTAAAMPVSVSRRAELERMAGSAWLPHRQVVPARGLLWASDGVANEEIARSRDVDSDTLRRWRFRFAEQGADGAGRIAMGRGRKPSLPAGTVEEVLKLTRKERPADGSTLWSTQSLAACVGIGKDAVAKTWADHNVKPWKVETFKISNDPHFDDKLVDVVGLGLTPLPGGGVQLRRGDPVPGAGPNPAVAADEARAGTMIHDYKRNGTIDPFAATNVATGEVLTDLCGGHIGADVLRFFKQIDANVPRGPGVHVVVGNLSAHSTPEIVKWLVHKDRRRWHLHYTPTSSFWLNLVERWFKELSDKRLRCGTFTSVAELTEAITDWAAHWSTDPKLFIWKATAEDIIAKVQCGRAALHQIKPQTGH